MDAGRHDDIRRREAVHKDRVVAEVLDLDALQGNGVVVRDDPYLGRVIRLVDGRERQDGT